QIIELVADNDASLQPETHVVSLLPDRIALSARLDDGTVVAPAVTEGLFTFPLGHDGQAYQLRVSVDGGAPTFYDSALPSLVIGASTIGRLDRVTITKPTTLTVTAHGSVSGDFALFDSTGVYMQQHMTPTAP